MRIASKISTQRTLKHTIERDSTIVPGLIAESVLECASNIVGQRIPAAYIAKLNTCAEAVYAHNRRFKSKLRGECGRGYLHMYMQHWLAHLLRKDASPLCHKLPRTFYWPEHPWRGAA